jgi:hypothetical protein
MKVEKLFHKCGYPILFLKQKVGPAEQTMFVDGNDPVVQTGDGQKKPRVISRCPKCQGFIKIEKLFTDMPTPSEEDPKAPSGYIPARFK